MSLRSEAVEPMPTFERSLRDAAITHMAKALYVRRNGGNWRMYRPKAESALDALLDFLGAHTEEWQEASIVVEETSERIHHEQDIELNLVAALRGTTEEQ